MEMAEYSVNGLKTLFEKEKLLITSNFSFSHSVFKRLVLQTRENQGLFGKGLIPVNVFVHVQTHLIPCIMTLGRKTFQIISLLNLYQTSNFRLFQTERVCRQQFQIR